MRYTLLIALRVFCATVALGALAVPYIVPLTDPRLMICRAAALVAALSYVATYIKERS